MLTRRAVLVTGATLGVVGSAAFVATVEPKLMMWTCTHHGEDAWEHWRSYDHVDGTHEYITTIVTRQEIEDSYDRSIGEPHPINILTWIEQREGRKGAYV